MVSAPTLPKFQAYRLRIYVVYTPYFLRTLLSLPYLLPSPSLPFSRIFFYFIWDIPGIFSRIFFVLYSIYVVYSWKFFWNFFWNFFLYILYMSWFFWNFFWFPLLNFLKFFSLYSIYVVVFLEFFSYICSIYVVYM